MKTKVFGSIIIPLVMAVLLVCAPVAQAEVLFHEDFNGASSAGGSVYGGRFVDGFAGQGWQSTGDKSDLEKREYLEYAVPPGFFGSEGTVGFYLKRDREIPTEYGEDAIIEVMDNQFRKLFQMIISWAPPNSPLGPYPLLRLGADAIVKQLAGGPWGGEWVSLGQSVSTGEWIHLAITWGNEPGQHAIYLNGEKVIGKTHKAVKNAVAESGVTVGSILSQAAYIRIGGETLYYYGPDWTFTPMNDSVVDELRIYDIAFNPYKESPFEGLLEIASLDHDAYTVAGFSGALVEGDELTVTMEGTAGETASFDIARRPNSSGEISLDWRGYYDEADNSVALEDVDFYRVYAAPTSFTLDDVAKYRMAADDKYLDLGPGVYRSIEQVGEIAGDDQIQTFLITDLDPYLAYFVMVTAVDDDDSMVVSTVDAAGEAVEEWIDLEEVIIAPVGGLAMAEDADNPGTYSGMITIAGDLNYPEAVVVGHLGALTAEAGDTFPVDTSVRILVSASPSNLKADEKSTSEITVEVRNANGDTISGHPVALSLTTTSEYTGVIGGGQFEDEVGGELSLDFSGETDLFGTVTATFTAGFAAKTAVIVAKDLVTNDVGSGYVTQFIEGTTDIELIGLRPSAAKAAGYTVVVTSNRDWLTADGSSRANITAQVLQDGNPVSGHTIIFSVVGEGRVSVINALTDSEGYARAVYTAGTRIGWVLIKATDVTVGISGSTQIELRSDAPAKVAFLVDVLDPVDPADSLGSGIPELYADGSSKAALEVLVTDINDNPNKDTEVDFSVAVGSGSLEGVISLTDEDGKAYATYVAGQIPGTVTVKVTVSSKAPTEAEKAAAENAVLTVPDFEFITE